MSGSSCNFLSQKGVEFCFNAFFCMTGIQWKVPKKRLWGLLKLGVPDWIAHKVANWGDYYHFVATKSFLQEQFLIVINPAVGGGTAWIFDGNCFHFVDRFDCQLAPLGGNGEPTGYLLPLCGENYVG